MKRFLIAICIFVGIIGVCVTEYFVTEKFEKNVLVFADTIKYYRQNGQSEECTAEIIKLKDYFDGSEQYMDIFCHEITMDDIEKSISRLESYSMYRDDALFYSELETLYCELSELNRSTGFTLRGII